MSEARSARGRWEIEEREWALHSTGRGGRSFLICGNLRNLWMDSGAVGAVALGETREGVHAEARGTRRGREDGWLIAEGLKN